MSKEKDGAKGGRARMLIIVPGRPDYVGARGSKACVTTVDLEMTEDGVRVSCGERSEEETIAYLRDVSETQAAHVSRALPRARVSSPWISLNDARRYLHLRHKTLKEAMKAKELPYVRMGQRYLFDIRDLDAWYRSKFEGAGSTDDTGLAGDAWMRRAKDRDGGRR